MSDPIDLRDEEFRQIVDLVYARYGINLTNKRTLVHGRLNGTVRKLGHASYREYVDHVYSDQTGRELQRLVDRLSTNHTYFFREADHFDFLIHEGFPSMWGCDVAHGLKDARIWCAGCATGEEPYSLTMLFAREYGLEALPAHPVILATDISVDALTIAKSATYVRSKARVPDEYIRLGLVDVVDGETVTVRSELTRRVLFKRLNLMRDSFPFSNPCDVVFCRNVMIYFDVETRQRLVRKFLALLQPGGYLFLGHSESMGRHVPGFDYVRPGVYRRKS